jgi:hypothetical protein
MTSTYNKSLLIKEPKEKIIGKLAENSSKYHFSVKKREIDKLTLSTSANLYSWGEEIEISFISENVVNISSSCKLVTQIFDWGKNKRNVKKLIEIINN